MDTLWASAAARASSWALAIALLALACITDGETEPFRQTRPVGSEAERKVLAVDGGGSLGGCSR